MSTTIRIDPEVHDLLLRHKHVLEREAGRSVSMSHTVADLLQREGVLKNVIANSGTPARTYAAVERARNWWEAHR